MAKLTIPQAAAALGVSVDTVRRRIKAGQIRAQRNARGTYMVDLPARRARPQPGQASVHEKAAHEMQPDRAQDAPGRPPGLLSTDAPGHLPDPFDGLERRRISDYLGDLRGLRELLEAERQRTSELVETVRFHRRQLEQAEAERRTLVTVIETLQQHFGIEQLQRILGEGSWSADSGADKLPEAPSSPGRRPQGPTHRD